MAWFGRWAAILCILMSAFLAACGGGGDKSANSSSNQSASQSTPQALASATAPAPQIIEVKAVENGDAYSFVSNRLQAKPGSIVVKLTNQDGNSRPHTFAVKKLDGNGEIVRSEQVEPGKSLDISFVITDPGSYQFLCVLRGHADRGQTGTLVVGQTLG
jgi:uncharacterized cupredoxin-like copper-binding protein